LFGAVSSVDQGAQGAAAVQASSDRYAIYFDAFGHRSQDYAIPGGRQKNTFVRADGQSIGSSVFFDGGYAGFNISRTASLYGIPGEGADHNARIDLEQFKFLSKGEFRPQSQSVDVVRFWFGASDYKHNELEDGAIEGTYKNRELEGRVEVQ